MKKLIILSLAIILFANLSAQVPDMINYQAVIRDNTGELLINQNIDVRISIINNMVGGTILYSESHDKTTNDYGLVNIIIGEGSPESGDFSTIDWSLNDKYLKIEVDAGSGYIDMGTVQLLSVPYAFYAKDVENNDDADASPTNEIQDINLVGTDLSITSGSTVNLGLLQDGVDDADNNPNNELQTLTIDGDTLEISGANSVVFPYDSSQWAINGNNIYYNTGNVGIGSSNPISNLEVKSNAAGSEALFQVINANNDTVFAVYNDGVKIFVDPDAKGKVGGFTISGKSPNKAGGLDILRVTPDSTRFYVNDTVNAKGKVGGFAVSGRSPSKSLNTDLLFITADSTRIYVNENTGTKGKVGGFAVSGRSPSKGTNQHMFVATTDSTRIFTQDTINGFGVRSIAGGTSVSYLQLSPLNYFIGHESGELVEQDPLNPGMGKYNTFFGYKTGQNTVSGFKNIFMGYQAGQANISGGWNIFIGNNAGANSEDGLSNIFIGDQAGYNFSDGVQNVFIGNEAGYSSSVSVYNNLFVGNSAGRSNVSGNYNTYVGISAGYNTTGDNNAFIGNTSGFSNTGSYNTYLGSQSGIYTGSGTRNVYIGYKAGYRSYGTRNVFIGTNANNTSFSSVDYSNCIAIGDSVIVSGDNEIWIGNSNATDFYAQGIYNSTTASAANLYIYASGRIVRSTSSKRYKKDIASLEINTSDIYNLNPVSFTSLSDNKRHFGLIAEEVAEVIPELAEFAVEKDVIPGSESDKLIPDGVQYPKLSVLLLNEVQKHESIIKDQQSQIEELKSENKELKQKLNEILEMLDSK
ncbi:tail fiber domain-containing protein [Bacteroidota bacterium]